MVVAGAGRGKGEKTEGRERYGGVAVEGQEGSWEGG